MKKQELIHLHGLLAEVSNYYEEHSGSIDLSQYEDLSVRPTSIHKSKTEHKRAVFALASGITSDVEPTETEAVAPQAD
jgi:hypothetical protein